MPQFDMPKIRPVLSYYGGKWRSARHYPEPTHATIIEPFAGGAGYSLRYYTRDVVLVEKNPKVAAIWRYLLTADPERILALPDVPAEGLDSVDGLEPVEEWLIGFWLNVGTAAPRRRPSQWALRPDASPSNFWGAAVRRRLASAIPLIRHWRVIEGDYTEAPNVEATWFVDPPYQEAGKHYPCQFSDFSALGEWCRARRGQVICCEQQGADWLPFKPLADIKVTKGRSSEVVWIGGVNLQE